MQNIAMLRMLGKPKWINFFIFILITVTCILFQKIFISKFDLIAGNLISGTNTIYLKKGVVISQPFIANKTGLSRIDVLFTKQDNLYPGDATIDWKLLSMSQDNSLVAQGKVPVASIQNGAFYSLTFAPVKNSFLNRYVLVLSSPLEMDGIAISSSTIPQSKFYAYQTNNKPESGTIVFYTGYAALNFNLLIFIRGILFALPIWITFLYRRSVLIYIEQKPLHVTATTVILFTGFLMIILQPPLHMFDEPEHFRRVWEVSTGKLVPSATDGQFTTALPEYIQYTYNRIYRSISGTTQNPVQILQMLLEPAGDEKQISNNGLISTYSFLAYVMPAVFVRIGIWLGSSALGLIYLARIANLIQFSILTYLAIKHARIGKQTIATTALLGLVITQGSAINVDSLLMGGSFLFFASVFNLIYLEDISPITKKEIIPLVLGTLCILISKHIYIPIILLVLLIPYSKFGTLKNKWKWVIIYLLAAGLFSVFLQVLVTPGNDPRIDTSNINPIEQLKFILISPISWLRVFFSTMINNGYNYYQQFNLLNGTNQSIGIFGLIQLVATLFFSWSEKDQMQDKITSWHRIFSCFIIIITGMFIALPLYLYWTPIGAEVISGLQGRYFLPIILFALITFRPNFVYHGKYIKLKLLFIMTFLLIYQIWMICQFFY